MVALGTVEDLVSKLWPSETHAVVSVPDRARGEQLVLVTGHQGASRADIIGAARSAGVPELFVPRRIVHVERVPVLASGKIDYVQVKKLVDEPPVEKPSPIVI
jgi:acyl-[acyl-carrier-protein]-phospholipid O-acyltransferase/long-chain-fatty-acid--[acyl-carrier-protein] ligase